MSTSIDLNIFTIGLEKKQEKKRKNHLKNQGVAEEDYDNIMEYYDVGDAVAGAKYSVDILKDKERVKYTGRPDGNSARDRGYYTYEKIKVVKNKKTINAKVYDDWKIRDGVAYF